MTLREEIAELLQANHGYGSMQDSWIADQIIQKVLAAIGEDEPVIKLANNQVIVEHLDEVEDVAKLLHKRSKKIGRNQLRAELRDKFIDNIGAKE